MLYQIIQIAKSTKFELFQSLSFGSSACAVNKCLLTVDLKLNEFKNLSCWQVVTYFMSLLIMLAVLLYNLRLM